MSYDEVEDEEAGIILPAEEDLEEGSEEKDGGLVTDEPDSV